LPWPAARRLPRAGNFFFADSGKMTKMKKIVLEYEGQSGRIPLPLR
jgi:hypothetical protein